MLGKVSSTVTLGVLLWAAGPSAWAVPISDPPAVAPGATTTAMADFGISGSGYFDLWLDIPSGFELLRVYDDDSDGGTYTGFTNALFTKGNYYGGWALYQPYDGASLASTYAMNEWVFNDNGELGLRVTDQSGGTWGFSKIKLDIKALPSATPGDHVVPYSYQASCPTSLGSCTSTVSGQTVTAVSGKGSLNITVTGAQIPAAGIDLLLLSGLGGLFAAMRRRRQA